MSSDFAADFALKTEHTHLPVTALAHSETDNLVLAGRGSHLDISRVGALVPFWSRKIFDSQTIHGIIAPGDTAFVWGGRFISWLVLLPPYPENEGPLPLDQEPTEEPYDEPYGEPYGEPSKPPELEIRAGNVTVCEDWILSCSSLAYDSSHADAPLYAAVVTAHNALILLELSCDAWAIDNSQYNLPLKQHVLSSGTQSILYSADLQWLSPNHILVVGGSPFGTITVWSFHLQAENFAEASQNSFHVHCTFEAHPDAAVFGVSLSRYAISAEKSAEELVLFSCSDDRTIKAWCFPDGDCTSPAKKGSDAAYELGDFFPTIDQKHEIKALKNEALEPLCFAKVNPRGPQGSFGHGSRIWAAAPLKVNWPVYPPKYPLLISLGEDASAQVWELRARKSAATRSLTGELRHITTYNGHAGKNIWAFAAWHSLKIWDPVHIASVGLGGADGAISIRPLDLFLIEDPPQSVEPIKSIEDQNIEMIQKESLQWSKMIKSYGLLNRGSFLAVTSEGHVLMGEILTTELTSNCSIEFRSPKGQIQDLKNYSTIATLYPFGIGFIGSSQGNIYSFKDEKVDTRPAGTVDGKVDRLFTHRIVLDPVTLNLPAVEDRDDHNVVLLATQRGGKASRFWIVGRTNSVDVPSSPSQIATSMHCVQKNSNILWLFVGSRSGEITKNILSRTVEEGREKLSFLDSETTTCHEDAVTMMCWIPEIRRWEATEEFLLSVARDSTFAIHRYSSQDIKAKPQLIHRLEMAFGPNIEGMFFYPNRRTMFLYGFQGEDFILYNYEQHSEVAKIHCGGAHRLWDFKPPLPGESGVEFIWTKASMIHGGKVNPSNTKWLRPGGHGREIKACAIRPRSDPHTMLDIIATGAEDTEIRLQEYERLDNHLLHRLSTCHILRKHVTGLQHLQWSKDGRYLFSSGGCQEFLVWRISRGPWRSIGVVLESKLPPIGELSDLRIMGFHAIPSRKKNFSGEKCCDSFQISMALSNSTTRVYRYTGGEMEPKWQLLGAGTLNTSCLACIQYIPSNEESYGSKFITGSTDGSLAIWEMPNYSDLPQLQLKPAFSSKIFQNTIKSFKIISHKSLTDPLQAVVVGCGDDNSLGVTVVKENRVDSPGAVSLDSEYLYSTLVLPRAHAASVNDLVAWPIKFATNRGTRPSGVSLRAITASNDQKLKVWDIDVDFEASDEDGISIRGTASLSSDVADASSIAIVGESTIGSGPSYARVALCGVGMEIWQVSKGNFISCTRES